MNRRGFFGMLVGVPAATAALLKGGWNRAAKTIGIDWGSKGGDHTAVTIVSDVTLDKGDLLVTKKETTFEGGRAIHYTIVPKTIGSKWAEGGDQWP